MLARHHWVNDLHDAGYRPRRMKFPQELNGYVFKTKASHLDGGHRLWSGMERDGPRHATLHKTHHMKMKQWEDNIKEWTVLECNTMLRKAENREEWRKLVLKSTVVPQRSARLRDR